MKYKRVNRKASEKNFTKKQTEGNSRTIAQSNSNGSYLFVVVSLK